MTLAADARLSTANIRRPDTPHPGARIYAGFAGGSPRRDLIGTNRHYGATARIEAFLLGFAGDLYGRRLVVELWKRLRDEMVFDNEQALIDQIARDVEATEQAERPG